MIIQMLVEGGITQDDIIKMTLDALIAAIPALLAMVIEDQVSMVVPPPKQ